MKILVLNGPNLNLLGKRDTAIYGTETLEDINNSLMAAHPSHEFVFFQSNLEGELIDSIQAAMNNGVEGLMANFGAYTHTSVALHDALEPLIIPKVEVHLSNIHAREAYREKSLTGEMMKGVITGFGKHSYHLGVQALEYLHNSKA